MMFRMFQRFSQVAGLSLICLLLAGCGGKKPDDKGTPGDPGKDKQGSSDSSSSGLAGKRLIVLMNNTSPFWVTLGAGVEEANKEFGTKATLDQNTGGPDGQVEKLKQYNTQTDIAGVAISVTDKDNPAIAAELRNLRKRGVQVITVDSDCDKGKYGDARRCFVGTDNPLGGELLGLAAKQILPDGGEYVCFVGLKGAHNAIERMDGFQKGAGEKFKELARQADDVDDVRAQENVRNALLNFKGLNCLVGIWSYNAPAIATVVKANPEWRMKGGKVATFDAEPGAIKAMQEGLIDVMVVQDPFDMGFKSVKMLKALVEKDDKTVGEMLKNPNLAGDDWCETGLKVVAPDKDDTLKAESFGAWGSRVEFMKLKKLADWLKSKNLQGS